MSVDGDITKWLQKELTKDRGEEKVRYIILRHSKPGEKGNDVETFDLSERTSLTFDDLSDIAEEICGRAQADANGMGGQHRYVVSIHIDGTKKKAVARWPFRIKGYVDDFDEAGGEEGPNLTGLVSQLMRHNEAMAKTLVHSVSGITNTMARRLESSDNTIVRLNQQAQDNLKLLEEAKSEQHTRDMELLSAEQKSRREDMMFEKLSLLVPVVINRLAGQKVFDTTDPAIMMLKGFTESMTVDQFKKIQSALSPEQTVVLMQLMKGLGQKQLPDGEDKSS